MHLIKFPQMETSSSHWCVAGYISRYLFFSINVALPHSLTREDEYEGYRIPAHSIVIGNAWCVLLINVEDYLPILLFA